MQERSVEGLHARVTKTLGGRPLSVAGLGLELKWQDIERLVRTSAQEWIAMMAVMSTRCFESLVEVVFNSS